MIIFKYFYKISNYEIAHTILEQHEYFIVLSGAQK